MNFRSSQDSEELIDKSDHKDILEISQSETKQKEMLREYFQKQLEIVYDGLIDIQVNYDSISTNVDCYDDELKVCISLKGCKDIFPNIRTICISYEYPSDDDMSSNYEADEIHIKNIDMSNLTKEKIDAFCKIMSNNVSNYKKNLEMNKSKLVFFNLSRVYCIDRQIFCFK